MYLINELTLLVSSSFMYLSSFVLDKWLTKQSRQSSTSRVFLPTKYFEFCLPFQWHCFFTPDKTPLYNGVPFDASISQGLKCNHTAISTEYWKCLTLLDEGLIVKIWLAKIWVWTLEIKWICENCEWKFLPSHSMVSAENSTVNSVHNISVPWKTFNVVMYHEIRSGAV